MPDHSATVVSTANPALELALQEKLRRRAETGGGLGELEPLALRIGLVQNAVQPVFDAPQLVLFAADHGLAVEGVLAPSRQSTTQRVASLLAGELPLALFAQQQGLTLSVVDCGVAEAVAPHPRLLARKIAHGTRNLRLSAAMTVEQAHAAIRAGMEIGKALPGNAVLCAGIGVGAHESAALVMSRLSNANLRDLVVSGPGMNQDELVRLLVVLQGAQMRHRELSDPVEVLAALGGFEIAMMAGVMLSAASQRRLIVADGLPAYAALLAAERMAPAITNYAVFSRSHVHLGLDHALQQFQATALLELGLTSIDGTGAALAWPVLASAATLLSAGPDAVDVPLTDAGSDLPG